MRDERLAPGQGFVFVPIAEQQAAQMLFALEGVNTVWERDEEGEGDDAEVGDAEDNGAGDGDAADGAGAEE